MYITNQERPDGFGAQFQYIVWSILYAECNGNRFVYRKIKEMAHNYEKKPNFVEDLEAFMGIRTHYPSLETVEPGTEVKEYRSDEFYKQIETNINMYHTSDAFQKVKKAFYEGKQSPFDPAFAHVAVHVRRPNSHDDRKEGTTTPDAYYLTCIQALRMSKTDKPWRFHIYSQGDAAEFEVYKTPDTILHLNEDIQPTFLGMVFADALITSGSSYSYMAALLSNGIVIYKNFWHPPLATWHLVPTPYTAW